MFEWFKKSPNVPENLKVVGVSKEESKKILSIRQKAVEKQLDLQPYEREKPKELLENIRVLNERLTAFFAARGITWHNISENQIHLVEFERVPVERRASMREGVHGAYGSTHGEIVLIIKSPNPERELRTHLDLVHEMIHANAFSSFQPQKNSLSDHFTMTGDKKEKDYYIRRQGVRVITKKDGAAFGVIDEAIVEGLTKQFDQSGGLIRIASIKDDWINRGMALHTLDKTEEGKRRSDDVAHVIATPIKGEQFHFALHEYAYQTERALLDSVVTNVQKKFPKRFPKKADVFQLFVEAEMTGHLLPLARVVEEVYGKGSFRRLAEWDVEKSGTKFE